MVPTASTVCISSQKQTIEADRAYAEVKIRIKDYLATHPGQGTKEKWIRGIGWDQAYFGGLMPTAVDKPQ